MGLQFLTNICNHLSLRNNMKTKAFITSLTLASCIAITAQAAPLSILEVRDSLDRQPIILPESYETDVHQMMHNWYLTNYADIDRQADNRASVSPADEEIIARLGSMPTVVEMPFNSVVRAHIIAYTDRRKQLVENMLGMSLYYMPIFEQALDRLDLPLELKYLPVIESALNPDAVSKAGATGLWQFMMATAQGEGLEVNSLVDERRDPRRSSEAAAGYLKKLYDIFGDWSLAIAAYNCGPGNVTKAIRRAGDGPKDFWQIYPYLPNETRGYLPAFIAANYVMNFYDKHNISPALARKPIVVDTIRVTRRIHFEQIRDILGISLDELRALNPQYRKDLIPGDIRPYTLVLPTLQICAYIAHEDSIANHNASNYGRRDVVEPARPGTGSDANGEYTEEQVVKWHTVKRGETLTSIAGLYGVTPADIRRNNKVGKKITRGQRLKIITFERRYISSNSTADADSPTLPSDSTDVEVVALETVETDSIASPTPQAAPAARPSTATQPSKPATQSTKSSQNQKAKTHRVAKGDSLYKIASKYGITVNALKKANNLTTDKIQVGQRLTIPQK